MKKHNKKGFTLVELVVVIAIVAILGAVSVVGYFAFIEKANKSADEQLCAQYNTLLKAESQIEDDIPLSRLVNLIEENGIRSNHFRTVSKDYTFAYHASNKECVLLNKDSGDVIYPKKENIPSKELWTALDPTLKMQKGVSNYTLFEPIVYRGFNGPTYGDYNFDLNTHIIKFNEAPSTNLHLENGIVVTPQNDGGKIIYDTPTIEKVNEGSKALFFDNQKVMKDELNKVGVSKDRQTQIIADKYIAYTGSAEQIYYALDEQIPNVKFVNCVFDRVYLATGNGINNLEVDNCKFYNCPSNNSIITMAGVVGNVNIHDCSFMNFRKCINLNLSSESITINKNHFLLNSYGKAERKDNAIQITLDDVIVNDLFDNWNGEGGKPTFKFPNLKVNITNNVVTTANAFMTLNDRYGIHCKNDDQLKCLIDTVFTDEIFNFANNTIKEGVAKFAQDPGVEGDAEGCKNTNPNMRKYYDSICNKFQGLIK